MKQISLDDIEFEKEEITTKTEWIKLNIGDALIGIFVDRYKDTTYGHMKYIFQPANIIRIENGERETYDRIGMNSTGNLDYKLNAEILGQPLKILRITDLPPKQKGMNPIHQFSVYMEKQNKKAKK